jgi:hypothetical protein
LCTSIAVIAVAVIDTTRCEFRIVTEAPGLRTRVGGAGIAIITIYINITAPFFLNKFALTSIAGVGGAGVIIIAFTGRFTARLGITALTRFTGTTDTTELCG